MDLRAALFIPDCHIPFEDKRAYDLMIAVARRVHSSHGLDEIVIGGDYLDVYGLSRYDKDPSFGDLAELYDRELLCANARLDELDKYFPESRKIFLEGNHEHRMTKYMKAFAGPLRNRITMPQELRLDKRPKWQWVPYVRDQAYQILSSPLWARHEPFGGAQVRTQAQKAGCSFIYGHTHCAAEGEFMTQLAERRHVAINSGWLGDVTQRVFDYCKDRPSWRHAFTLILANEQQFHTQLVKIESDYSCVIGTKRFQG